MDYNLLIDEQDQNLIVEASEVEGVYKVTIGENIYEVTPTPVGANLLHLKIDGEDSVNIYIAHAPDGLWVWSNGMARFVQDKENQARRSSKKGGLDGPKEITPKTPSTVVSVLVKLGQNVDKGQGVVVVSAMKMESTLTASYKGTVTSVNTEEGAKVSPGEILIEIKADEISSDDGEE